MIRPRHGLLLSIALAACPSWATDLRVTMQAAGAAGPGDRLGVVVIEQSPHGLVLRPALKGLASGMHGFHVHENPSCAPGSRDGTMVPALAAGGHFDPDGTGRHGEPWGAGHRGDLPALYVAADGSADMPVLAPRLKLADVRGRSLVVHAGGDNHSDQPQPLGGGGARVACGVIGR